MVSSGQMPKQGWGSRREAGVRRVGKEEGSERQSRQATQERTREGNGKKKRETKRGTKGPGKKMIFVN